MRRKPTGPDGKQQVLTHQAACLTQRCKALGQKAQETQSDAKATTQAPPSCPMYRHGAGTTISTLISPQRNNATKLDSP